MKTTVFKRAIMASIFFSSTAVQLVAQNPVYPYHPSGKKLITLQASSYMDMSSYLATNLTAMQTNRPYIDGICFSIDPNYGMAKFTFNNEVWTETSLRFTELQTIATKWTTCTDNFILVWGHSRNVNPDFFNDTLWARIIANTRLLGKAVAVSGCKGIMFDPEFYSGGETYSPWWYVALANETHKGTPPYSAYTFAQVKAKAQQRGKEYVQALQVEMPKITIMTTFLWEYVWEYCYGNINNLPNSHYALLSGFADGMLDGLNPGSVLVDGNETSYYYNATIDYDNNVSSGKSYSYLRLTGIPAICDPALISKWNLQGQIAMAPYVDHYVRNGSNATNTNNWIKHNTYNSLLAADQYAWLYIEGMNFWTGAGAPAGGVDVFASINDASTKYRNGSALGFDMMSTTTWISTPTVTITSPSNNYLITNPGTITINATVNPATSISKVEFFANAIKIGEDATSPYSITKSFLKADYTVYARVFKTDGTHTTSAPIIFRADTSTTSSRSNEKCLNNNGNIWNIYMDRTNQSIKIMGNIPEHTSYAIINTAGAMVKNGILQPTIISIHNLACGLYTLKLENNSTICFRTFMIADK